MQKVERKAHREGKHRRLIWLGAAVMLLAGSVTAALLFSGQPTEIPEREQHWGMLIDRASEELVSVTVHRRGEQSWTLVRTENGEWMPEGGDWTVEGQQGTMLQEAMTQLRYEEILTEDPAVYLNREEEFGLADPMVTVTARYTDGGTVTVNIGDDTGLEEEWHYMTAEGDERLYAVSSGIVQDLDVEYSLLHPVPRPEIYASLLDRISVTDGEGRLIAEWSLQGAITDRDAASNWAVTAPFFCPADEEAVQNLKKTAENIRLGIYTAPATAENLVQYGLEEPEKTLVFHMAKGSTGTVGESGVYDVTDHEEATVTLAIGKARDDLTDYVRFEDEIFAVSRFTMSALTETDPMSTAARYPVLIPLASLESLLVEEDGSGREYVLKETERMEDGETVTETKCLLDGNEISYESFEAAYDRLLTVTFSGKLPEGAEWKEPYKKYTFRTRSGGTHTVTLSDWDGIHDAVTVDGSTLFYLIKGGMTELPAEEQ